MKLTNQYRLRLLLIDLPRLLIHQKCFPLSTPRHILDPFQRRFTVRRFCDTISNRETPGSGYQLCLSRSCFLSKREGFVGKATPAAWRTLHNGLFVRRIKSWSTFRFLNCDTSSVESCFRIVS